MKKQIDDLTNDENRMLIDDLQAGRIAAADLHPGCWFESDPVIAFDAIEANERAKLSGDDYDLILIGPARALEAMRPIIWHIVHEEQAFNLGELKSEDRRFERDPDFGVWEKIAPNQNKLHLVVPDDPDPKTEMK